MASLTGTLRSVQTDCNTSRRKGVYWVTGFCKEITDILFKLLGMMHRIF